MALLKLSGGEQDGLAMALLKLSGGEQGILFVQQGILFVQLCKQTDLRSNGATESWGRQPFLPGRQSLRRQSQRHHS